MNLYHYYDKRTGPFRSLTMLSEDLAESVLARIKEERPEGFCAKRDADYLKKRRRCEEILKREFEAKGGIVDIPSPYYMVVEHCPWLHSWYERPEYVKIPIAEFDLKKVSFTYGDSMPTFGFDDGKEYRKQVYTYEEILKMIDKYGLPQDWNADGKYGPERYIEAHVWTDEPLKRYMSM